MAVLAQLLAWASALPPLAKKVLAGVVLLLLVGVAIWLYGRGKEAKGVREAVVQQSEVRATKMLDTAKHDYAAAVKTVATIRVARRAPPAVKVVRPGVVQVRDTQATVPVEVTQLLDTNRVQLARDTVVFDSLLFGWHHALDVVDSTTAVKNVYKADAGNHHLVLKVAGISVGVVGLALLVHHLVH
jgi:hypothetical protein